MAHMIIKTGQDREKTHNWSNLSLNCLPTYYNHHRSYILHHTDHMITVAAIFDLKTKASHATWCQGWRKSLPHFQILWLINILVLGASIIMTVTSLMTSAKPSAPAVLFCHLPQAAVLFQVCHCQVALKPLCFKGQFVVCTKYTGVYIYPTNRACLHLGHQICHTLWNTVKVDSMAVTF